MKHLHKLKILTQITAGDRLLLLFALVLLSGIRLGLWLLSFRTLLQVLTKGSQMATQWRVPQVAIAKIIWAVNVISRYFAPGSKCLARALTTKVLLDWQGHPSDLRIGVAKGEMGQLEAHAWVEVQEQIVMGDLSDLSRYSLLPTLQLSPSYPASGC
jgi:Transglutaminase-like superfamily